jgi:hypothetical protein
MINQQAMREVQPQLQQHVWHHYQQQQQHLSKQQQNQKQQSRASDVS